MDPLRALADIVVGWHRTGMLNRWIGLVFQMGFSFAVSFCAKCGHSWVKGEPLLVGMGWGLIFGASSLSILFVASPLTRGMLVIQPKEVPSADPDFVGVEKK